jgi:hypothetical protein
MTCEHCKADVKSIVIHGKELWCWPCHNEVKFAHVMGAAAYVIGDDIPGGIEIRHGVCNDDGTPKKYYTKSSIREAAYHSGYFQGEDTPKSNPRIVEQRAREKEERQKRH